ncbi:hypothetical protein ACP70R_015567 [Stipagrostis hirtigluma subsp. patula]
MASTIIINNQDLLAAEKVEVPPKLLLIHVFKSLKMEEPKFTHVGFPGAYQVHVTFVTNIPFATEPFVRKVHLKGEICETLDLAMRSAVKKTFHHLEDNHNVEIIDISSEKLKRLRRSIEEAKDNITRASNWLDELNLQWGSCLDILYRYKKDAFTTMELDEISDKQTVEGRILNDFCQMIDNAAKDQLDYISIAHYELMDVNEMKDKHWNKYKYKYSPQSKAFVTNAFFHPKEALAFFLDHLGIDNADFLTGQVDIQLYDSESETWATPPEYIYYESQAKLNLKQLEGLDFNGTVNLVGAQARTIAEAEDNAAKVALFYLEKKKKKELVDYNFSKKVEATDELEQLKTINNKYMVLGSAMLNMWSGMIDNLQQCVIGHNDQATTGTEDEDPHRLELILKTCAENMQKAAVECASVFQSAKLQMEKLLCL